MIQDTISREAARRYYDRLGTYQDWAGRFEGRAKNRALALLAPTPGGRVLNVGVGTGKEHVHIAAAVAPGGVAVGLDVSPVMLRLTRTCTGTPVCLGDARRLPYASASFDYLFAAYVLDLLPAPDLPGLMHDFRRVLVPGGRLVLVTLTEGVDRPSRALIALWKRIYAISPEGCGGCRPLQLSGLVRQAGFRLARRKVVVQWGVPSEIIVAESGDAGSPRGTTGTMGNVPAGLLLS